MLSQQLKNLAKLMEFLALHYLLLECWGFSWGMFAGSLFRMTYLSLGYFSMGVPCGHPAGTTLTVHPLLI